MKKLHEFYTAGTGTALLIGNPQAAAMNAPEGKRYDAWKDAYGNALVDMNIGGTAGLIGGAGLGAGAGALAMRTNAGKRAAAKLASSATKLSGGGLAERLINYKGFKKAATPAGALIGGIAGLGIGSAAGLMHGHYGKRAQEIRNRHLSANLKPVLRELAARSEKLTELAASWVGPSGMNAKGQRPEDNWGRAAGMGILVGGAPGAVLTQPLASASAKEGVIYRKRDAATDSLRLGAGGVGGALAGGMAGLAAQRFIPRLHGRAGAYAPVIGNLAGMAAGLVGGYKWAKGANDGRIKDAKLDRMKTKMASAYISDQIKKQIAKGQTEGTIS